MIRNPPPDKPLDIKNLIVWNKCSNRMPTKDGHYLVFYRFGVQEVVNFGKGEGGSKTEKSNWWYIDDGCVHMPECITHWAELPSEPKD